MNETVGVQCKSEVMGFCMQRWIVEVALILADSHSLINGTWNYLFY